MSVNHGYLVPTVSSPWNWKSKESRVSDGKSSLKDPDYIYPDSCPNGDPISKTTTVHELESDCYGYSDIRDGSNELPKGVYSAIINTKFNRPVLACKVPNVTNEVPWKKRFWLLLMVVVVVVVSLLITLALVANIDRCLQTNNESHNDLVAARLITIEPLTIEFEIIRCDACTYDDARFLCRSNGKRIARLQNFYQLEGIVRKTGDYRGWNTLAWTNIQTREWNRIKDSRNSHQPSRNTPSTPYLFLMCYPLSTHIYNISKPDVKSRVYGVLCQKSGLP